MTWDAIFQPKKTTDKPIINQAVDDKNAALNDIYNYQNQNIQPPADITKKIKK